MPDVANRQSYRRLPNIPAFESADGALRYKARQVFDGVPILGHSMVIEEARNGNKRAVSGTYASERAIDADLRSGTPRVSETDAIDITYAANSETFVERTVAEATLYIYYDEDAAQFFLVYVVEYLFIVAGGEVTAVFAIVDAMTGDLLVVEFASPSETFTEMQGIGGVMPVPILFEDLVVTPFDTAMGPRILQNDHFLITDDEFTVNNGHAEECLMFGDACYVDDNVVNEVFGVSSHAYYNINQAHQTFMEWHGSPATPGQVNVHVNYGALYLANAFFAQWSDGDHVLCGNGDIASYWPLCGYIEVAGHELAHGFTRYRSNLAYFGQHGGMNEAYSDLAGIATRAYDTGDTEWTLARRKTGTYLRYMYDPPLDGRSIDHYADYADGLDVHYSSGLYNKLAYLLSQGDKPWSVEEIFVVTSHANELYWDSLTSFHEGFCGLLSAIGDIYSGGAIAVRKDKMKYCGLIVGLCCTALSVYGTGSEVIGALRTGNWHFFLIVSLKYAVRIDVVLSAGDQTADLFVKFDDKPKFSAFDCVSWSQGTLEEICSLYIPEGTISINIGVYAYQPSVDIKVRWVLYGMQ